MRSNAGLPRRSNRATRVPRRGLGHLVRELSRTFSNEMQRRLVSDGITLSQWLHLRALWDRGAMSQTALSRYLGLEKASSTAVLSHLQSRQLLKRTPNRADGRVTDLELTAKGGRLVRDLIPRALDLNSMARIGMTKQEVEIFMRVAQAMIDNLNRGI